MKRIIIILICLGTMAGCDAIKAGGFVPHSQSISKKYKLSVFYIIKKGNDDNVATSHDSFPTRQEWLKLLQRYRALRAGLDAVEPGLSVRLTAEPQPITTRPQPSHITTKAVVPAATLAVGVVDLMFKATIEALAAHAKEVKGKTEAKYSTTQFVQADKLKRCIGLIILRTPITTDKKGQYQTIEPDLLVILKINRYYTKNTGAIKTAMKTYSSNNPAAEKERTVAWSLTPTFALINRSIAQTLESDPQISLSLALAVKAIALKPDNTPCLVTTGQGAITIRGLKLPYKNEVRYVHFEDRYQPISGDKSRSSEKTAYSGKDRHVLSPESLDSIRTDLIPVPIRSDTTLSVSMTLLEVGNPGFEVDRVNAQLTAIKDAIGPSVSTIAGTLISTGDDDTSEDD